MAGSYGVCVAQIKSGMWSVLGTGHTAAWGLSESTPSHQIQAADFGRTQWEDRRQGPAREDTKEG